MTSEDYLTRFSLDDFAMHTYLDEVHFNSMKFDHAIRRFLGGFLLPLNEGKMNCIIQKFAKRYFNNPSLFT